MSYLVDNFSDPMYNKKIKIVYEKDKTFYKLYHGGKLAYISEVDNEQTGNEVRNNGNEHKRSGETRRT
jgi:hypothetical protein